MIPTPGSGGSPKIGACPGEGTGTALLYDGLNPVQEQGTATAANLLTGLGIDEYFVRTTASTNEQVAADALGSTVALSDGNGTVQTNYTYDPFGATTTGGTSTINAFGFTGREEDTSTLRYLRARYYDARLQRFIAEDPLGFGAGDTNLYGYVFNRPTQLSDPTGEIVIPLLLCAGGAGGSALADWMGGRKFDPIKAAAWCAAGLGLGLAGPAIAPGASAAAAEAAAGAAATATAAARAAANAAASAHETSVDANKLNHFFNDVGHGLEQLVQNAGSQEAAYRALQQAVQKAVNAAGTTGDFTEIVNVGGVSVDLIRFGGPVNYANRLP